MPTSLLLAIACAAGVAAGVFLEPATIAPAQWAVALFALACVSRRGARLVGVARWCVTLAIRCPCARCIGSAAEERAMHPPLRQFSRIASADSRSKALDLERHETPLEIEGRLMADAYADRGRRRAAGARRARVAGACLEPAEGGVSLTVAWVDGGGARSTSGAPAARFARRRCCGGRRGTSTPACPIRNGCWRGAASSLVGTVKSAALVQVVERGSWFDETAAADPRGRRGARSTVTSDRAIAQSAAIAVAILIGDRGALDPDVEQRLQEAGTYHVIAISGGNIAILAGLVLGVLWAIRHSRRLGGRRRDRAAGRRTPTSPAAGRRWCARR